MSRSQISRDTRLRILLVSRRSTLSVKTWSGIAKFASQSLEPHADCVRIDMLLSAVFFFDRFVYRCTLLLTSLLYRRGIRFHVQDTAPLSFCLGRIVFALARMRRCDIIFGLSCANYIAGLPEGIPVAHMVGAHFMALRQGGRYADAAACPAFLVPFLQRLEQRAASRADHILVPSIFGSCSFRRLKVPGSKISVIPYGANLAQPGYGGPRRGSGSHECSLLFIGIDWERKGGPVALGTVRLLRQRGIPAVLHVVGPRSVNACGPDLVLHGRLHKEQDAYRLADLFGSAFLFLLPTHSELFGVVFREAAAHGLPSLAYDVEGVNGAVKDGTSGVLLESAVGPCAFADAVERLWKDPSAYERLCDSTMNFHRQEGGWQHWADQAAAILKATVGQARAVSAASV